MHNNVMAAGSRDRPPMLATGRYAQWQSRFLRYIDTRPNGDALRKCILQAVETILNMSPENKAHYESKNEAIHLLLTRIRVEIYSTVDACKTAHEMWISIERLQQGESLNIQDVNTNLFWEFGKFTSHDGESMESYYSRFYKMMNEMIRNNLTVATMQYQKKVNEIRAEIIAQNANPLALVVAASPYLDPYYQAQKSHKPYARDANLHRARSGKLNDERDSAVARSHRRGIKSKLAAERVDRSHLHAYIKRRFEILASRISGFIEHLR
ncbi:hypothetical protein Tco_0743376 [Tanacetum coccineum]